MKYIATSVPGKTGRVKRKAVFGAAQGQRDLLYPQYRLQFRVCGRTTEYSGMKAQTSWPSSRKFRTSAPATSARPPVFAYGRISELKTHSFNADIIGESSKGARGHREKRCRRWPNMARWHRAES